MNTTIPPLIRRKDFRSQRPLVLLYWGALALSLVHHLELAVPLSTGPWSPGADLASGLADLLGGVSLVLTIAAAAAALIRAVIEDGPADGGRFLASRPVTQGEVVFGKLGFAVRHLAAPAALAAGIYLAASGMGWADILLGVGQVALIAGGFLLICGAFALLWPSGLAALGGVAAAVAAGFAIFALLPLVRERVGVGPTVFSPPAFLQAASAAALVMALTGLFASRRPAGQAMRLSATAAGAGVFVLVQMLTPWRALPSQAIAEAVASVPAEPELHVRFGQMQSQDEDQLFVDCEAAVPANPEAGFWTLDISEISLSNRGQVFRDREADRPDEAIVRRTFDRGLTPSLHRAVATHLGSAPFWLTNGNPSPFEAASLSVALPGSSEEHALIGTRARVLATAHLWNDQVVADLPLRDGASAEKNPGDHWTISTAGRDGHDEVLHVGLVRRQREFWLSPDPSRRNARAGLMPGARFTYVLYDPARQLAIPVRQSTMVRESRGTGAGLARHALVLRPSFNQLPSVWRLVEPSDLRLIIVERSHALTRTLAWESHPLASSDLPPIQGGAVDRVDETLDRGAFAAWFDALERPGEDAARATVAAHIVRILEQSARCRFSFDASHPAAADLARFVPGHLDLFLEAIRRVPYGQHHARQLLSAAIVRGATEAQRGSIVDALPSTPQLMEVVMARGWAAAIVPELPLLAERLGHDLGLLARIEAAETGTAAPLVERFRRSADRQTYSALRAAPDLPAGELDALVADVWSTAPPAFFEHGWPTPALESAIRHGIPDALQVLHHAIGALYPPTDDPRDGSSRGGHVGHLLNELVDTSVLPENERWDTARILEWFLSRKPEAFRFDPVDLRWTTEPAKEVAADSGSGDHNLSRLSTNQ